MFESIENPYKRDATRRYEEASFNVNPISIESMQNSSQIYQTFVETGQVPV